MMRVSHAARSAAKCSAVSPAQSTGTSLAAMSGESNGILARAASLILAFWLDGA
ncbi:hypothetical protein [Achromobacter xylosoxidans]|uniref:hypothetical protein n=1 Tax=Alcaligenes xylosoxydans xylosoxydans TaxID=85698 RepID=UPI00192ACDF7|nr:hypothetical protein [Achromobacter xylosoxidans]